jgi:hypothetical protein
MFVFRALSAVDNLADTSRALTSGALGEPGEPRVVAPASPARLLLIRIRVGLSDPLGNRGTVALQPRPCRQQRLGF